MPRPAHISDASAFRRLLRSAPWPWVLAALVAVPAVVPRPASAQWAPAAGAALGAGGGAVVTAGWIVARARSGHFLYDTNPVRPELFPVAAGAALGAWMGARDAHLLWRSAGAGALGLAAGSAAGAALGRLLGDEPEDVWAGGLMGAAAGLVAGAAYGALTWREGDGRQAAPPLSLQLSWGWR